MLKPVEVPQVRHDDKFVDVPDATYRQVPTSSNRAESMRSTTCSIPRSSGGNPSLDAGANIAKRTEKLWMLTERIVDAQVVLKRQIQYPDTGSNDPKVQKTMTQTTRLQEIMKVPLVAVIDEVGKVPGESCRDEF